MTHPGEQFYPEGVHWDDPIAQGTLPELLSEAAREFSTRPAIEFRDRPISYAELQAMVEVAATAYLRAGYGRNTSVALFLGNTPDHPTNFFGALKAGARIVHLSPLDGELALSHKLSDSGARVLVTSNLSALLPTALKFLGQGLLDRLIVCEDDRWGKVGTPQAAIPNSPAIVTYTQFIDGATRPAQWPAIDPDDVAHHGLHIEALMQRDQIAVAERGEQNHRQREDMKQRQYADHALDRVALEPRRLAPDVIDRDGGGQIAMAEHRAFGQARGSPGILQQRDVVG